MPADNAAVRYELEVYKNGLTWQRPPFTFQSGQWEEEARKVLSANSFGYVRGNAGTSETYNKNLAAFQRWSILPSRLVPSHRDDEGHELFSNTTTKVLGHELPFPMAAAPVGVQKIFHAEGELASARATASVGIPYVMSSASSTSIEDVAAAHTESAKKNNMAPVRWFQLYWPTREHDDITISMLSRAKESGFTALFVTLDTYAQGWRPADMDNGYNPFIHPDRVGVQIGLTDPVFKKYFQKKYGKPIGEQIGDEYGLTQGGSIGDAAREWTLILASGHSKSWEDLEFLKKHWDGPIVLKGIQTVADARKAVEVGMAGIVVSNHGGRQHDGGVSSLGVLPRIVDAVGDKLDVLFDSGIRSGADIIKAIALGAKCVLVGRPYVYGLAIGGEDGVKHVLRSLWGDALLNMHLGGQRDLSEVNRDMLIKEDDLFR
ncbi:FMN-dependent alpha-hydroxy acid dehydrogenase, partial [Aureobasidium melanogenum]